jgi:hypothetical protein
MFDNKKETGPVTEMQRVNYQIIHFTKFCQVSDKLSNLSKEVLSFYIKVFQHCKESYGNNHDEYSEKKKFESKDIQDLVLYARVQTACQNIHERFLPPKIMKAFLKHIERHLRLKDEAAVHSWVDFDKFMD